MSVISGNELRTRVEWARNNGKASHEPGGRVRFEHEGQTYVIPAELLAPHAEQVEAEVDLTQYAVRD
jgi:hypothetical protein